MLFGARAALRKNTVPTVFPLRTRIFRTLNGVIGPIVMKRYARTTACAQVAAILENRTRTAVSSHDTRNVELGLIVRGGSAPREIRNHMVSLIDRGVFQPLDLGRSV